MSGNKHLMPSLNAVIERGKRGGESIKSDPQRVNLSRVLFSDGLKKCMQYLQSSFALCSFELNLIS